MGRGCQRPYRPGIDKPAMTGSLIRPRRPAVPAGAAPRRDNPAMHRAKVGYLEGLRGVAASQVVLMHFVSAFLPDAVEHAASPWQVLFDGHTAVYLFFLISGAVLTPAFARGAEWLRPMARRVVRLGIPVAAAAAIALMLLMALPHAHLDAARISGSAWLAMDSSGAPTVAHWLREVGLDSMLLGYREYTLFAPLAAWLPPLEHSLDAPFWSLHLELYGSALVLGLVRLRAWSTSWHRAGIALCAVVFGTHPMFLFVLGHLCAYILRRAPVRLLGFGLILLGLALSGVKDWSIIEMARVEIAHFAPVVAPNLYQLQSQLAAVALFLGVLFSPMARWMLDHWSCQLLGRWSFSIYLLHFPILFTLGCASFAWLADARPAAPIVAITFCGFAPVVLLAAASFERWVDRPAIRLSRLLDVRRGA
jgi:peptidoglycan/LPS O-acetylase OafA/YrhL